MRMRQIGAAALLALAALCVMLPGPLFAYRVTSGGSIPSTQQLGHIYHASVWFKNDGKAIPHPVLDLSGMTTHWELDRLSTNMSRGRRSQHGDYWRFGTWKHGATWKIDLIFHPTDPGTHYFDVRLWAGWNSPNQIPTRGLIDVITARVTVNRAG